MMRSKTGVIGNITDEKGFAAFNFPMSAQLTIDNHLN